MMSVKEGGVKVVVLDAMKGHESNGGVQKEGYEALRHD